MRTSIADRWKRRRKTSLFSWSIKSSGRISGERAKSGDRESDSRCANDYTAEAEGQIENTNFLENEEFRPWPRVICPRSSTRPTISRLMQSWTKTILFSKRGVSGRTSRCWAMILGGRFFKPFKMKVFRLSLYPSSFAFQHVLPSFDINDLTTNDDTIRRIFFDFFFRKLRINDFSSSERRNEETSSQFWADHCALPWSRPLRTQVRPEPSENERNAAKGSTFNKSIWRKYEFCR